MAMDPGKKSLNSWIKRSAEREREDGRVWIVIALRVRMDSAGSKDRMSVTSRRVLVRVTNISVGLGEQ